MGDVNIPDNLAGLRIPHANALVGSHNGASGNVAYDAYVYLVLIVGLGRQGGLEVAPNEVLNLYSANLGPCCAVGRELKLLNLGSVVVCSNVAREGDILYALCRDDEQSVVALCLLCTRPCAAREDRHLEFGVVLAKLARARLEESVYIGEWSFLAACSLGRIVDDGIYGALVSGIHVEVNVGRV